MKVTGGLDLPRLFRNCVTENLGFICGRVNNRRKVIFALGACVVAAPLAVFAQQGSRSIVVGTLRYSDQATAHNNIATFRQSLKSLGYVEGKNLTLHLRFADGNAERLPELATELVRMKVDVILAMDTPSTRAAQRATTEIPIVFGTATDPVGSGLVASLAKPGGNTTGLSNMSGDISAKYRELLVALQPKLSRVAMLVNPSNSGTRAELKNLEIANKLAKLTLVPLEVNTPEQIERAFDDMVRQRVGSVIVANDAFFNQRMGQIARLALQNRILTVGAGWAYAESGFLISYGAKYGERYGRAAALVDKIIKGAKPADLPVEQPTLVELALNMKTAKALGIKIPDSIMLRADKVIE